MKKTISMVMAAAMVTSLVPATAFAETLETPVISAVEARKEETKQESKDNIDSPKAEVPATVKVVGAKNYSSGAIKDNEGIVGAGPEVQVEINKVTYTSVDDENVLKYKFTVKLDNADFDKAKAPVIGLKTYAGNTGATKAVDWETAKKLVKLDGTDFSVSIEKQDKNEIDVTLVANEAKKHLEQDDYIYVNLADTVVDKRGKGQTAKVAVTSDDFKLSNSGTDLTYVSIQAGNLKASAKKVTDIAVKEVNTLEDIVIEPSVGDNFSGLLAPGKEIRIRVNKGFEFVKGAPGTVKEGNNVATVTKDGDELVVKAGADIEKVKKITLKGVQLDAGDAKSGAVATLKISAPGVDTVSVEVAKAIDSVVKMSVEKSADLPVIYSGADLKDTGLAEKSDHESLEVTIEETFAGAWNTAKDFTLTLPKGVYIATADKATDGIIVNENNLNQYNNKTTPLKLDQWFVDAYKEGDFTKLLFKKRQVEETKPGDKESSFRFQLKLVADPNFEGDVTLKLEGDAFETQEVKIAKFVKPFTVKAEQNNLKIDYRQTKIPTSVTITEAQDGLWKAGTRFALSMEKIAFDNDAKVTVDEKSGMKLKNISTKDGIIYFTVDKTSADKAAVITISDMTLFMNRSLPAGAYDLDVYSPTMLADSMTIKDDAKKETAGYLGQKVASNDKDNDMIAEINDDFYSTTAKAGFVNIVTAGREDAESFTTKVVVPVGEKYLMSGETKVELDVAAYINAGNYTMLPIRAVAKALGIPNANVVWNGEARTATIMYGSKVITMTVGQKTMYINGAPVPTSSAVEIKEENGVGRAFLPMRDLGVALGVTDITWDAATRTATLNSSK